MGKVFFITHFPVSSGPNPDILAAIELAQVNDILLRLPPGISVLAQTQRQEVRIICGTGLRHLRTAMALGLIPTHYSPCVGCPDLMLPHKKVLLSDGSLVDEDTYSSFVDDPEIYKNILESLKNGEQNSIIITDPYLVKTLGGTEPAPGQLFQHTYQGGRLCPHRL